MMKPIIISLEGNIGAGKSTLLEALESTVCANPIPGQTWVFLKEPVHLWSKICDADGNTMLSKFYSDPAKYSFAFQIMAFTTRLRELRRIMMEHPGITGIICERSLDADREIFAKMLHDGGQMEDVEYEIYRQYFDLYDSDFKVDGIIYAATDPETCYRRVSTRSREGESGISLEYLKSCRDYHEGWLRTDPAENMMSGRPILCIDTSSEASFYPIDQQGTIWLNQMIGFLHEIVNRV